MHEKLSPSISIDEIEKLDMLSNKDAKHLLYKSLFAEVADTFIQYINTLTTNEIEQLDNDLKANGLGVKSILGIGNSIELLCIFQMYYYYNGRGRLPLTNGLLSVPD